MLSSLYTALDCHSCCCGMETQFTEFHQLNQYETIMEYIDMDQGFVNKYTGYQGHNLVSFQTSENCREFNISKYYYLLFDSFPSCSLI